MNDAQSRVFDHPFMPVQPAAANAGALGRNSLEISDQGGRLSDNNVQVNGADANNPLTTNLGDGGGGQGVAVPAPDTIQEFKVQTALCDASTGRNGGANIDVVTKSGTNHFHGDLYEFFRNEDLNANDFFLNRAGVPRPRLRQNQFGFTFGGPNQRNKTFFFLSYEGNRQSNGVTAGSTSAVFLPPLIGDRSAGTLGKEFGGQKGFFGGVAVAPDGSNINPVALAILDARLPSGQFVIPTPQILLPTGIGESTFPVPAPFSEAAPASLRFPRATRKYFQPDPPAPPAPLGASTPSRTAGRPYRREKNPDE